MGGMSEPPILSIDSLRTVFGRGPQQTVAVDGLSVTLRKGHTLGVVGESGSGKSVTSLTAMRLLPRTARVEAGRVSYLGRDLAELSEAEMRDVRGSDISMIFQEPGTSLNPVFTVGTQVVEAIRRHQNVGRAEARRRTVELFTEVGIPDPQRRIDTYPHEMSGGQKQRVMIAMALSCNPEILIADEPTTALDVTIQSQILDLIRRLRDERGMAVLFITHDLGVIAEIADEVAVMYRGRLVEYAGVEQIFTAPQHPYTKGLLACRPRLDNPYRRLPTVADFMQTRTAADGSVELVEKAISEERLHALKTAGRGPLLHPGPVLKELSHPAEEAPADATFVPEETRPLLSVRDLKVHYPIRSGLLRRVSGAVRAVDGISFDVYAGQTLGLVGESGCGKTTTGRAIVGLTPITGGRVTFDGEDVSDILPSSSQGLGRRLKRAFFRDAAELAYRRRVQVIFQDPYASLNPRMTVQSALIEAMATHRLGKNRKDRRERAAALLEEVGLLSEHLPRYPHEFSGGQRQRICIARALAVEPDFVICDESVSALDVSVQAQVCNLLKDLRQTRNLTYIFISHDLSVVKFMSDMMAVMQPVPVDDGGLGGGGLGGRIVEFGPAEAIYAHPKTPYTRRLIEAIPDGGADEVRRRVAERARRRDSASRPA